MLPMKNTNAGKDTEAKLLPVPLWKPLSLESHCFLETSVVLSEPPGTLAIVKMSHQDHPLPTASLTSQRRFPLCAETQIPAVSALKQPPSDSEPGMRGRFQPEACTQPPLLPPQVAHLTLSHSRPHILHSSAPLPAILLPGITSSRDTCLKVSSLQCSRAVRPSHFCPLPPFCTQAHLLLSQ